MAPNPMDAAAVVARILSDQPTFHGEGTVSWFATEATLRLLATRVRAGDRTVETGAGASTVVLAALGADHTAISPAPDEHTRIAAYCSTIGVDASRVKFIAAPSDQVVPHLEGEFDFAFIDGAHSFPFPVVDWCYLSQRLRVGGLLLLDDVPIPAVGVAFSAMVGDPAWEQLDIADGRAVLFRKVAEAPDGDYWRFQAFNEGWPDYSFLPATARVRLAGQDRARSALHTLDRRLPAAAKALRRLVARRP